MLNPIAEGTWKGECPQVQIILGFMQTVQSEVYNESVSFLQPGWEERTHTDGRIFFINHSMYNVVFSRRSSLCAGGSGGSPVSLLSVRSRRRVGFLSLGALPPTPLIAPLGGHHLSVSCITSGVTTPRLGQTT